MHHNQIYDEDLPILKAGFYSINLDDVYFDALVFRANNDDQLSRIETLERRGHLRREEDKYYLWPTALAALAATVPEAANILANCDQVLRVLRAAYKLSPRAPITLETIVQQTQISDLQARKSLWYIAQGGLLSSYSYGLLENPNIILHPSEEILRIGDNKTFIDRLSRWLTSNAHFDTKELAKEKKVNIPNRKNISYKNRHSDLPEDIRELFSEIDIAIENDLRTLAAMGLRTVVEMVCIDILGDTGTFKEKLQKLESKNHITSIQHGAVSIIVDAGNAAAHRGFIPDCEQLNVAYRIVLGLAESRFVLPLTAEKFKNVPQRPRK